MKIDPLPRSADTVLISVNPKAGRRSPRQRADRLVSALESRGLLAEIFTDLGQVSERANSLYREGRLRALVGVGGDGTAAELVNRTEQGVPVTLLASGTANLLAKYLKLSKKPETLAGTIADGHLVRLDAGLANGRLFLVMVSCGFDADVVEQVHTAREQNSNGGHINYRTYINPIRSSIRNYRFPELCIESDSAEACRCGTDQQEPRLCQDEGTIAERVRQAVNPSCSSESAGRPAIEPQQAKPFESTHETNGKRMPRWAFVFNLPGYGLGQTFLPGTVGIPLAPGADGTDGVLDLCSFDGGSLFHGFKYVAGAMCGGLHRKFRDCSMQTAERFRIAPVDAAQTIPYQLDGDPGGVLPLDVEVLPGRLTLLVPKKVTMRLGG